MSLGEFGKIFDIDPLTLDSQELRTLLTNHGVIVFRGHPLSHKQQVEVMSHIGSVQNFMQQQAPIKFVDKNDPYVILLHNEDFLGHYRTKWHMDQTYLQSEYLPIRSLYCTSIDQDNETEFADVVYLTDQIELRFKLPHATKAKYYIDSSKTKFSERSVFADCSHLSKKVFRYDARMEFVERDDSAEVNNFCKTVLNSIDIPRLSIKWEPNDFVIFDNNRCPHRRRIMNGKCHLSRLTCDFWIK